MTTSRPKAEQNGFIGELQWPLRDECLNDICSAICAGAEIIEAWRIDYNTRDHTRALAGSHRRSSQHALRGHNQNDSPHQRGIPGAGQLELMVEQIPTARNPSEIAGDQRSDF